MALPNRNQSVSLRRSTGRRLERGGRTEAILLTAALIRRRRPDRAQQIPVLTRLLAATLVVRPGLRVRPHRTVNAAGHPTPRVPGALIQSEQQEHRLFSSVPRTGDLRVMARRNDRRCYDDPPTLRKLRPTVRLRELPAPDNNRAEKAQTMWLSLSPRSSTCLYW